MKIGDMVKITRSNWEEEDIDADSIGKYIDSYNKSGKIINIYNGHVSFYTVKLDNGEELELDEDEMEATV